MCSTRACTGACTTRRKVLICRRVRIPLGAYRPMQPCWNRVKPLVREVRCPGEGTKAPPMGTTAARLRHGNVRAPPPIEVPLAFAAGVGPSLRPVTATLIEPDSDHSPECAPSLLPAPHVATEIAGVILGDQSNEPGIFPGGRLSLDLFRPREVPPYPPPLGFALEECDRFTSIQAGRVIRGSVQRLTSNRCTQPDDRHGESRATKEAIRFQAHRVAPGSVQSQRAAPSRGRPSCVLADRAHDVRRSSPHFVHDAGRFESVPIRFEDRSRHAKATSAYARRGAHRIVLGDGPR